MPPRMRDTWSSVRRLLALLSGCVLCFFALVVGKLMLHAETPEAMAIYVGLFGQILAVVLMVFKDYFGRQDRTPPGATP